MKPFLCLLLFVTVTHGQDIRLALPRGRDANQQNRSEEERNLIANAATEEYKHVFARWFRLEVDRMQRHLKLSAVDARKLHVAAKGAVTAMVKKNSDRLVQSILRQVENGTAKEISINGVPIVKQEGDEEKFDDEAAPISPNRAGYRVTILVNHVQTWISVRQPNGGGGTSGGGGTGALLAQEIWTKSRDKVLSKEQQKSYEDYRDKLVRSHLTEILAGQLALKILLPIEERKKLHDWVEQQIAGEKIDKRHDPAQLAPQLLSRFKYTKLKGILSDDQIEVLKQGSTDRNFGLPFGW